jgi:predicted DNA-binding transcriptional regulator YafY
MSETSSRLLELLSLLQGRRDWRGGELAERLGVSRRTVRRDVERLRELGYPIHSLVGPAGGYRLAAGAEVPPLLLDDEEAVAIAVGLRTAARASVAGVEEASLRALVKLEQVLPSRLRPRLRALQSAETLGGGGPTVDPECLATAGAACRDSERLRFAYRDREGAETRREVEPHSLVNAGRRWYLVAWDLGREDWRTFRLDRIARPAGMGVRFTERKLPAKDASAYVMQSIRERPNRYVARVVLHAPTEDMRKRLPAGWGSVEPIDGETCEYRTGDDDLDWLALRVVMLRVDFEVRDSPELAERLTEMADRLARAAGRRGGRG